MRKKQLIQLGILAIALISGYKSMEYLVVVIIALFYQFTDNFTSSWFLVFQYLLFLAIYVAGFILLVRYSKQIADYIDKQGNPDAVANDETVHLSIQQSSLLFIVLIALCLITLIEEIPVLLLSIYSYFKKEAGSFRSGSPDDLNFKTAAIKFVFTIIVLFSARSISAWFSKQSFSEKPLIETTGEPDETNSLNL